VFKTFEGPLILVKGAFMFHTDFMWIFHNSLSKR